MYYISFYTSGNNNWNCTVPTINLLRYKALKTNDLFDGLQMVPHHFSSGRLRDPWGSMKSMV